MKYNPEKPSTIVGVALESFDGTEYMSEGTIEVNTVTVSTDNSVCTIREIPSG